MRYWSGSHYHQHLCDRASGSGRLSGRLDLAGAVSASLLATGPPVSLASVLLLLHNRLPPMHLVSSEPVPLMQLPTPLGLVALDDCRGCVIAVAVGRMMLCLSQSKLFQSQSHRPSLGFVFFLSHRVDGSASLPFPYPHRTLLVSLPSVHPHP
jgi:hypothetical protein